MTRYKPLRPWGSTSRGLKMSNIFGKNPNPLIPQPSLKSLCDISKYLAGNSKIVIEVISWRYVNYTTEVCEWLAESSLSLAEMKFLSLGEVFIARYSFYFWRENEKNPEFSTRFVFLLDYTCYHGESIHLAHRGWLNLGDGVFLLGEG